MSQFVLYMDEDNEDEALAATPMRAGMAVRRTTLEGNSENGDAEQLAFAAANAMVIYTSNFKDFHVLHGQYLEQGRNHYGIVVRTGRRWSVGEQARRLLRLWNALSAEEMVNRMESLARWGEPVA